jgi:hypothetical protein
LFFTHKITRKLDDIVHEFGLASYPTKIIKHKTDFSKSAEIEPDISEIGRRTSEIRRQQDRDRKSDTRDQTSDISSKNARAERSKKHERQHG